MDRDIEEIKPIPFYLHFIWAGGEKLLPLESLEVIMEWMEQNPEFKTFLWIDAETTGQGRNFAEKLQDVTLRYQKLFSKSGITFKAESQAQQLPQEPNTIFLRDITDFGIVDEQIRYELDKFKPNYGCSSDLIRDKCLARWGGCYFDSDVGPAVENYGKKFIKPINLKTLINNLKPNAHYLFLDHMSQLSNEDLEAFSAFKIEVDNEIGNDSFICTPNNPLMWQIYNSSIKNYNIEDLFKLMRKTHPPEKVGHIDVLGLSRTYGSQYLNHYTIDLTGPGLVRMVLCEQSDILGKAEKLPNELAYLKTVAGMPVYIKPLRCSKYSITDPYRNTLHWHKAVVETCESLPMAIEKIRREIAFEAKYFKILRLDDYVEELKTSISKIHPDITEKQIWTLLEKELSKVDFNKIKYVQCAFKFPILSPHILAFCRDHYLFEKTFLFNKRFISTIIFYITGERFLREKIGDFRAESAGNFLYHHEQDLHVINKFVEEAMNFFQNYIEILQRSTMPSVLEILPNLKMHLMTYISLLSELTSGLRARDYTAATDFSMSAIDLRKTITKFEGCIQILQALDKKLPISISVPPKPR
jgi:hypothetical protein